MKRFIALLLALLLVFSLVACNKDKGEEEEEGGFDMTVTTNDLIYKPESQYNDAFYYEYINEDEVAILSFSASHDVHAITIPDKIENRLVTEIKAGAFNSASNISSVTLPEGLRVIGDFAFNNCIALTSINFPSTLTEIGQAAFASCIKLGSVALPDSVTKLGYAAFYGCKSLTGATVSHNVKELPAQVFMGCEKLVSVAWSDEGVKVGDYAFMGCAALTTVNFPAALTMIGAYAFADCAKLTSPTLAETVEIGENAFYVTPKA